MAAIEFDTREWPLGVCTMPREVSRDDVMPFLEACSAAIARDEPHAIIIDCRNQPKFDAGCRKAQAAWFARNKTEMARLLVGHAYVVDSSFARGILTALFWLARPPGEHRVFPTMEEARDWCLGKLAEREGHARAA